MSSYLSWPFTILRNDNITISWAFFRLTAPRCPSIAAGAVSLRKSHDIVILSFFNKVKGQANVDLSKINYENQFGIPPLSFEFFYLCSVGSNLVWSLFNWVQNSVLVDNSWFKRVQTSKPTFQVWSCSKITEIYLI